MLGGARGLQGESVREEGGQSLVAGARLMYRRRVQAAAEGVQGAERAARALVPLGRALRAAVGSRAGPGEQPERSAALREVAWLAETLWPMVDC